MTNFDIRTKVIAGAADLFAVLAVYESPAAERSIAKRIPNKPEYHQRVAKLKAFGYEVIKRYRGPRRKNAYGRVSFNGQLSCVKSDATSFALYVKSGVK